MVLVLGAVGFELASQYSNRFLRAGVLSEVLTIVEEISESVGALLVARVGLIVVSGESHAPAVDFLALGFKRTPPIP